MSRTFDAKQIALSTTGDTHDIISDFLLILDCSYDDFCYENNVTPEGYLFGVEPDE